MWNDFVRTNAIIRPKRRAALAAEVWPAGCCPRKRVSTCNEFIKNSSRIVVEDLDNAGEHCLVLAGTFIVEISLESAFRLDSSRAQLEDGTRKVLMILVNGKTRGRSEHIQRDGKEYRERKNEAIIGKVPVRAPELRERSEQN